MRKLLLTAAAVVLQPLFAVALPNRCVAIVPRRGHGAAFAFALAFLARVVGR